MKIYIAGPMTGYPDFNYPAFTHAGEVLTAKGWDVLNPVDSEKENTDAAYQSKPWSWYLRSALKMVTDAEAICLLPGWEESSGARLEAYVAFHLKQDFYLFVEDVLVPFNVLDIGIFIC